MKFDSIELEAFTVPKIKNGISAAEVCILMLEQAAKLEDADINFNSQKICALIQDSIDNMNKIAIATECTVNMFKNAENANMQIIDRLFELDGDYLKEIFGEESFMYGVGQNVLWSKMFSDYYNNGDEDSKLVKGIAKQFNMSYEDAAKACTMVDSIGACTYAATANNILYAYRYDPVAFEEDFGYPMFVVDEENRLVVNSTMLLMDIYIYANSEENNGKLFSKDKNGIVKVNDEYVVQDPNADMPTYYAKEQKYLDGGALSEQGKGFMSSKNTSKVLNYEKTCESSKNAYIEENGETTFIAHDDKELKKFVEDNLDEDTCLSIHVDNHNDIYMTLTSSRESEIHEGTIVTGIPREVTFEDGHAMVIVGSTDEGIIVASWGEEYLITYENLNKTGNYTIMTCTAEQR
ncbi:MAG: hypothetical protein IKE91_02995 [Clostridia bacterium]|nr:hypothetical protein [Clostridia bacterium]